MYHENDTIAKYEIMDGAPVRGEEADEPFRTPLVKSFGVGTESCSTFSCIGVLRSSVQPLSLVDSQQFTG